MYQFDWSSIPGALPYLGRGMMVTLKITLVAILGGVLWGTLLAAMRLSSSRIVALAAAGYVNLFRAMPLVMVLLWFFLVIPQFLQHLFGLRSSADTRLISALVAFALFEAAYYSEIIRAGVQSMPRGQLAAALALGMNYRQAMTLIILPQAFRHMMPVLLTQAIILFQDTSLVYVSGLADFFGAAYKVGDRDGRIVEMMLFAGFVYLVICYLASALVRRLRIG